jgi:NitT/TauT family transport system permease protein
LKRTDGKHAEASGAVKILFNMLYPLITVGAVLLVWYLGSLAAHSAIVLPAPAATLERLLGLLRAGEFWRSFANTLLRSLFSFCLSFLLAAGLGVSSRLFGVFRRLIEPLIAIFRALPTVAVILLLVLWMSPGGAAVAVALLVIMPTLYAALLSALDNIDQPLFDMCRVFGVKRSRILGRMILPMLLPEVILTLASGLSLNLKLLVAAEVLSNTAHSLGAMMNAAKIYFDTAELLALTIVSVVAAVLMEWGIKTAAKPLYRWKDAGGRV